MGLKASISKPFAHFVNKGVKIQAKNAVKNQQETMLSLVKDAQNTLFGKDHNFSSITDYQSFTKNIKIAGDFLNNWKDYIAMEKDGDIYRKSFVNIKR